MPTDVDPAREILEQVAFGNAVSQRSLARSTGIALGLANMLIRRMVDEGWIRTVPVRANRVTYVITPAGHAEKARRVRAALDNGVQHYVRVRNRIAERLVALSAHWQTGEGEKRIVFFGASEVAEIGYFCVQGTDLRLVGVVDHVAGKPFFGLPVRPYEALAPGTLDGEPFETLVVMSFSDEAGIRRQLARVGLPAKRIFWI